MEKNIKTSKIDSNSKNSKLKSSQTFENIKKQLIWSFIIKLLIFIGACIGVGASVVMAGFIHLSTLLYFTAQSNIAIAIISLVFAIYDIKSLCLKKIIEKPHFLMVIKFICIVSITLTGLIFNCILLPVSLTSEFPMNPFELGNFVCHIFVPIVSIIDYIIFDYNFKTGKKTFLWGLIAPNLYFVFVMICSVCKVEFYSGYHNVPYFFFDYVENGWFNFNLTKMQIGLVWGGIIINAFIIGLSILLIFIKNKRAKQIYNSRSI